MKIIDNPTIGIGLLLCFGLAVLGLSLMPPAEGKNQAGFFVTSDEETGNLVRQPQRHQISSMTTTDWDDSPFIEPVTIQQDRVRADQADRAFVTAQPQASVRITTPPQDTRQVLERPGSQDSLVPSVSVRTRAAAQATESQPQVTIRRAETQSQQQSARGTAEIRVVRDQPTLPHRAEKRDELLFRIVKMRLDRGEYAALAPVILQMHNPETAIETMLDFAEESDDKNISQLLDVATAVILQLGQPRPPIFPGVVGGAIPGAIPNGMGGGMPPGQPMAGVMIGGMSGGGMIGPGMPMPPGQPGQPLLWDQNMSRPNLLNPQPSESLH